MSISKLRGLSIASERSGNDCGPVPFRKGSSRIMRKNSGSHQNPRGDDPLRRPCSEGERERATKEGQQGSN